MVITEMGIYALIQCQNSNHIFELFSRCANSPRRWQDAFPHREMLPPSAGRFPAS